MILPGQRQDVSVMRSQECVTVKRMWKEHVVTAVNLDTMASAAQTHAAALVSDL